MPMHTAVMDGMILRSIVWWCVAAMVPGEFLQCAQDDLEPWSYHNRRNGPFDWGKTYPDCHGQRQSPIAIFSEDAKDSNIESLKMEFYAESITKAKIENNGRRVHIIPEDHVQRFIRVKGKTFYLTQLHLHWGCHWDRGSEHHLNYQEYALEAHFVHASDDGQTAVVAVLFQETPFNNPAFEPIDAALSHIRFKGESFQLEHPLNLNDLLTVNPAPFYRYFGSLTTPPCSENVLWSVLKGVNTLGTLQLSRLRNMYSTRTNESSSNCWLMNNNRPIQKLNDRTVYSSK